MGTSSFQNRFLQHGAMKEFIRKYENRIHGVLSCFDRMLFRGYLPIMSGWAMADFPLSFKNQLPQPQTVLARKLRTRQEPCRSRGEGIWSALPLSTNQNRQGEGGA